MSRETLLDEAIAKAKECGDWQLVEWLRMARGGESAARWYSDKLRDAHRIERKLMDKNAKLRELVRTFYHCTTSGECDECPINGGGPVHLMPDTICDTIHDRMRELGVEV